MWFKLESPKSQIGRVPQNAQSDFSALTSFVVSRTTLINNLLILCDYLSLLSVLCYYRSETLGGARLVGGVARWSFLGSDEVSIPLCLATLWLTDPLIIMLELFPTRFVRPLTLLSLMEFNSMLCAPPGGAPASSAMALAAEE